MCCLLAAVWVPAHSAAQKDLLLESFYQGFVAGKLDAKNALVRTLLAWSDVVLITTTTQVHMEFSIGRDVKDEDLPRLREVPRPSSPLGTANHAEQILEHWSNNAVRAADEVEKKVRGAGSLFHSLLRRARSAQLRAR